ncbi:MAG: LysM peptidoglycan-binding domain-containing protein [Treponemataceae bacterium]|nr:LysM peptidoglycan-binding domain-containing protein [Treponemataceae bacterium]
MDSLLDDLDSTIPDVDTDAPVEDEPVFDDVATESKEEEDVQTGDYNSDFEMPDDIDAPSEDSTLADSSADEIKEEDFPDFGDIDTDSVTSDSEDYKFDDSDLDVDVEETSPSSGLYDENTFDETNKDKKKKVLIPVLICGICALVCIAVLLIYLFAIKPKAGDKKDKEAKNKVEKVVPAPVEEAKEGEAKEDEIVIVKTPVVVPAAKEEKIEEETKSSQVISYKIKWGDTLWDISETYYKSPWHYQFIADYNHIENADLIIAGKSLDIPPK